MKARTRTSMAWIILLAFSAIGFMHYDDPGNEPAPVPWQINFAFNCLIPFNCVEPCNPEHPDYSCVHYVPAQEDPYKCKFTGDINNHCTPVQVVCAIERRFAGTHVCQNGFCVGGLPNGEAPVYGIGCFF